MRWRETAQLAAPYLGERGEREKGRKGDNETHIERGEEKRE